MTKRVFAVLWQLCCCVNNIINDLLYGQSTLLHKGVGGKRRSTWEDDCNTSTTTTTTNRCDHVTNESRQKKKNPFSMRRNISWRVCKHFVTVDRCFAHSNRCQVEFMERPMPHCGYDKLKKKKRRTNNSMVIGDMERERSVAVTHWKTCGSCWPRSHSLLDGGRCWQQCSLFCQA